MQAWGKALAAQLRLGDVVLLSGPLGTGKTTLTQGIGRGLKVEGEITSPTFVIARLHRGPLPLIHVDAYRLRPDGGAKIDPRVALDDLDLDSEHAVTVMEWGDDLGKVLADSFLQITISFLDDNTRELTYVGHGDRWAGVAL